MKDQNRPNLFDFATGELSQDAFLAWFFTWADASNAKHDPEMHGLAKRALASLLDETGGGIEGGFETVTATTQYNLPDKAGQGKKRNPLDLLISVGATTKIAIEDKVGSGPHSNQLARYRALLSEAFPDADIRHVYLKTTEVSPGERRKVKSAKWRPLGRRWLLKQVAGYRGSNAILLDFVRRLERMESEASLDAETWTFETWKAFYNTLDPKDKRTSFSVENPPTGSFVAFHTGWAKVGKELDAYLQLVSGSPPRAEVRLYFHGKGKVPADRRNKLCRSANEYFGGQDGWQRPTRLGSGRSVAILRTDLPDPRNAESRDVIEKKLELWRGELAGWAREKLVRRMPGTSRHRRLTKNN